MKLAKILEKAKKYLFLIQTNEDIKKRKIEELRDKIFLLLGKHLIRFQTVEMRLKSLLKLNRTIILENKNSPLVIEPPVRNQTLGGLSTKALNSLFLLDSVEEDQLIKEGTNTLRIDMKFSFNFIYILFVLLFSNKGCIRFHYFL